MDQLRILMLKSNNAKEDYIKCNEKCKPYLISSFIDSNLGIVHWLRDIVHLSYLYHELIIIQIQSLYPKQAL